ncbi:AbrB/MazE/SpoVT family DNA-binding domain-containing protein [Gryllotalpicola reticulitermitis]|uniref:AbrB/MazE/SpoVT family DNA-binding domain-containing protein n=1 Tax=Gryllotalpicola reticulitermitis TaxID=1184153 RepID=A0ABV8Q9C5_9MICO
MSGTFSMTVGNKGRIVLPADVRARHDWAEGTTLIALETDDGIEILDRAHALKLVRAQFAETDVVSELIAERHAEAARDSASES